VTLVDTGVAVALAARVLGPVDSAGVPGEDGQPRRPAVYVDRRVRQPGSVMLGAQAFRLDSPALLVFRDEMPGANWMHPCTYALVDFATGDTVTQVAADRPPQFGMLPDSWVVAADPDGRADMVASEEAP
jgi:hypothetical protein